MQLPTSQSWLVIPIEPPKSTHQANLRVLRSKSGKMFVGKMRNNKVSAWVDMARPFMVSGKPDKPSEGPLRVYIRLYYSPPKYLLPKFNKCKTIVKITKPDCDNVVKVILDEFTKLGYWLDDAQIWCLCVEKYWSKEPSVQMYFDHNHQ